MKPGIYNNLPADQYHADQAYSFSAIKQAMRSPAHLKAWLTAPPEQTPAMRLGTLTHLAVLQPDLFGSTTAVAPIVDRRTKEGKSIWEQFQGQNAGKEIITNDEREQLSAMRDSVRIHPAASALLGEGTAEVSVFNQCIETGLPLKARMDWVRENAIVDLKTTEDASPAGFAKSVANYRYDLQAAHYRRMLKLQGRGDLPFMLIAVEKEAPFAVAVYRLDEGDLTLADMQMQQQLRAIASCCEFNSWPAYSREVETLTLPKWHNQKAA
ncbi:MAG: hypothetical protein RIR91_1336 [Verrucomicrobiota bacterium]|jgi:hypothetical protein